MRSHLLTGVLELPSWCEFALWGFLGGLIVDGVEFWQVVNANGGRCPRRFTTPAYAFAELIRLGAGAILAVAFGLTGQVTAPMGLLAIGIAAPIIVEKLSKTLPVIEGTTLTPDVEIQTPQGGAKDKRDGSASPGPTTEGEKAP